MNVKDFGNTEGKIVDLVLPIAEKLGYDLWDVTYEKEGTEWYLRVLIDKSGGITIDDAEKMTEPVNEILDKEDPISTSYILEVGSPGLERSLHRAYQFEASIGETVRAYKSHAGKGEDKEIIGTLDGFDENSNTVVIDGEELNLKDITYVKIYEEFNF